MCAHIMETKSIIDLVEKIESLIPSGTSKMTDEFRDALKKTVENHLHQLDLVTREEFDAQSKVLASSKEQLAALAQKVSELEQKNNEIAI